jgi:hypothetical protein
VNDGPAPAAARRRGEAGQATAELALLLPLVAVRVLVVAQVALLARAQVLVTHAAREAARMAAVDPDPSAAEHAARAGAPLDEQRLEVAVGVRGTTGDRVTVTVRYRAPTDVALVGDLIPEVDLTAVATMRIE